MTGPTGTAWTTLAWELEQIVGPDQVLHTTAGGPVLSVSPATLDELSQVMARAHAARARVVPWGGGTAQALFGPPPADAVAVCTRRLRRVLCHEPADLTLSIEAGATLGELAAAIRPGGLMLPVDAPLPGRATVGGVLARAADGPRRLLYGTLRDLLIGVTVVEATGRVSKAGGLVVKNVSGFDLMKLYTGSLGTLAIIASANFKLVPAPRTAATVLAGFERPAQAFGLIAALGESPLTPAAVEYLFEWTPASARTPGGSGGGVSVAVWAEGLGAAVGRHVRETERRAAEAGAQKVQVLEGAGHEALWARIIDLPQTAEVAPDEAVLQVRVLPSRLRGVLDEAARLAHQGGLGLAVSARALCGVAYLRVRGPAPALAGMIQRMAADYGPSLLVLSGPATGRNGSSPGLRGGAAHDLVQRIRREFDPHELLNPGRSAVGS